MTARAGSAANGHSVGMTLGEGDLVSLLLQAVPEVRDLYEEHMEDYDGDLLLHLFVARVRDTAIAAFDAGDRELAARICEVFALGLIEGDDGVENVVSVSFVEDTPWWDPKRRRFVKSWPKALRLEAERQRKWNPGST